MEESYKILYIIVVLIVFFIIPPVQSDTKWVPGGFNFPDNNKTMNDDSELCWAAAASNLLEWGNHKFKVYNPYYEMYFTDDSELIEAAFTNTWFEYYNSHWSNGGLSTYLGLRWLFEGIDPTPWYYKIPGVDAAKLQRDGGLSYSPDTYGLYHIENPGASAASYIYDLLEISPVAVSIDQHVITCYGIDYCTQYLGAGLSYMDYFGIWYTDSDDTTFAEGCLQYGDLYYDGSSWVMYDRNCNEWRIGELTALSSAMIIPEPCTILLLGAGGVVYISRKFLSR